MRNDPDLEKIMVQKEVHQESTIPLILTSGELSPYYEETERLCPDPNILQRFGNDPQGMMYHAVIQAEKESTENPSEKYTFQMVIDTLRWSVQSLLPLSSSKQIAIAGGQRKGWLFAGPIAHQLGLPFIALYKQTDNVENKIALIHPEGRIDDNPSLKEWEIILVEDTLTKGSSLYRIDKGSEKGWIPLLRERKAVLEHAVVLLTREQGGEEKAVQHGVIVHPVTAIDNSFLKRFSNNPETALAYKKDPLQWGKNYIVDKDITVFADYFNPQGDKLERAYKFLNHYNTVLHWSNKIKVLENAVERRYGIKFK